MTKEGGAVSDHRDAVERACAIVDTAGRGCDTTVDASAPLNLCTRHLLTAYEWVVGEVGVTDVLPSPCMACGSRLGVRYPSGWLCAVCEWKAGDRPDDDWLTVRVDVVYYIRSRDRIKIGTSANPRGRLAQLRYDELLAFERGDRRLEQRRHAQFGARRAGGEWFESHDALTEHIRGLSAGVEDPWAQHRLWLSEKIALGGRSRWSSESA
jgi:hypothetical protein